MFKQAMFNLIGYGLFIGLPIFFIIKVTQNVLAEGKPAVIAKAEAPKSDKALPIYS